MSVIDCVQDQCTDEFLHDVVTELSGLRNRCHAAGCMTTEVQIFLKRSRVFVESDAALIEYGVGAGHKAELVLKSLSAPAFYVPIDIAKASLKETADRIGRSLAGVAIVPLTRNFSRELELPAGIAVVNRVGFFPGSTIGNLTDAQGATFLRLMRKHVGQNGKAIIGVDLQKDIGVLLRAYDDRDGVTAEFNLNLLTRINRELEGNFRIGQFGHRAHWNATCDRDVSRQSRRSGGTGRIERVPLPQR